MLRQQLLKCQDYETKGIQALGEIVTLSSAINNAKLAEQKRAELVVRAQKNTLMRLKSEYTFDIELNQFFIVLVTSQKNKMI